MADHVPFTQPSLSKLEPGPKRLEIRDPKTPGLIFRMTKAGSKSWYWSRYIDGRHERIRIAAFSELTLDKARKRADDLNGKRAAGQNPAQIRRDLKAQITVGELWERYLRLHAKPKKRSWRNDELQYDKHLSAWSDRKVSNVSRSDVRRLHQRIAAKTNPHGGPVAANRVLALLSSMWGWANREDGLEIPNPCVGVKRSDEDSRKRYLVGTELRPFLRVVRDWPDAEMRDAVLLLLYTGQRKSNVREMKRSDLDLRHALWTIPRESSKSKRPIVVPLVPEAVEILQRRTRQTGRSDRVFTITPGRFRGEWERIIRAAELKQRLTPHDLRRTFATYMRASGADFALVGDALGHENPSVTGVYALPVLDLVRGAVERTVRLMRAIADGDDKASVIPFPGTEVGR